MSTERDRVETFGKLENGLRDAGDWYHWGPYLSERQWGTVREDYSEGGTAWEYLPHDHARSRAYRWGEDGLAGFSDVEQRLCLGLSLWNGRDPILKERIFGLTGNQGNHGEDAKEYWWYLDALPSHAWNRWRYHYPQGEFPYGDLVAENGRRGKLDPEYELLDTGVFDDDRYWIVEVDYAKHDPHDLLMSISVKNAGPETDTLHVLPTAWYRNTWSWEEDAHKPELRTQGEARLVTEHPFLGSLEIVSDGSPTVLLCENETNAPRLFGADATTPFPKDGINDHVVSGAQTVATGGGHEGSLLASGYGRAGRDGHPARAPPAGVELRHRSVARLRQGGRRPARRGRRVLFRAHPSGGVSRRGARHAPGLRRDALEQADVRLHGRSLARRRPDAADAARIAAHRAKRRLAHLRCLRHHVDARQVGVPVVRSLGSRLPLRRAQPRRPGLRQVPDDPALP